MLALQLGGWTYRGVVIWDKGGGSRPVRGKFRLNVEFAVWGSAGGAPAHRDIYPSAVVSCPPPKRRLHIAQKPVAVLEHLLSVSRPGGVVLDPFLGSGSSLVAARSSGMDGIGIELLPSLCRTAVERLRGEEP